jgi:CRISPR/Cas system-associated protein Csx1
LIFFFIYQLPMATLHVEMLNQICEFCDPHTRARVAITCSSMYHTLSNQTFLKQYAAHMRTVRDIDAIEYNLDIHDNHVVRKLRGKETYYKLYKYLYSDVISTITRVIYGSKVTYAEIIYKSTGSGSSCRIDHHRFK